MTLLRELGGEKRLCLSNYVLAEVLTRLGRLSSPAKAAEEVDLFLASRLPVVHWINEALHQEALVLFRTLGRRGPSFTDCTSFVLMRRLGISTAFTFDRDFAAAGFKVVPRAWPGTRRATGGADRAPS